MTTTTYTVKKTSKCPYYACENGYDTVDNCVHDRCNGTGQVTEEMDLIDALRELHIKIKYDYEHEKSQEYYNIRGIQKNWSY